MSLDVEALLSDVIQAVQDIVEDDWSRISNFTESQGRMLANQAVMITTARTVGSLKNDDDGFEFFLRQLEKMTRNFTQSIAALTIVTIEKAWNVVVGVVWGAVNGALSAAGLSGVSIPAAPQMG